MMTALSVSHHLNASFLTDGMQFDLQPPDQETRNMWHTLKFVLKYKLSRGG